MLESIAYGLIGGAVLGFLFGIPLLLAFHSSGESTRQAIKHGLITAAFVGALVFHREMKDEEPSPKTRVELSNERWFDASQAFGVALALTGWGISIRRKYDANR